MIHGKITDSLTGLPLSSVSVYSLESGAGSVTDDNGKYQLKVGRTTDSIAISMVGYETMKKPVKDSADQEINFKIKPASASMENVVIRFKAKYTLAQMLIRNVIKHKNTNDVFNADSYQCQVYDKIEVDAKNIPPQLQNSRLTRPMAFALKNMDTTKDNDLALPIFITESFSNFYFRKKPEKKRYDYVGIKSSGVDNKSFLKYVDGLYKNLNIYDNNIKFADVNFISPIADDALNFYNYNILDTLVIGDHSCIQVQCEPKNTRSNAFRGYLWITDTTFAVKYFVMRVYQNPNVNFIKKLEISQDFEFSKYNLFLPAKSELYIDLLAPQFKKFGAIVKKTTIFENAIVNNNRIDTAFEKTPVDLSVMSKDTINWEARRFEPLSQSELAIYKLVDSLQKVPLAMFYERLISAITTGYYTTGNVDIGNIYTFYTNNRTEGNRFNFGLQTNAGFNKKIRLSGYLGYSTKINQTSYLASSTFVLTRRQWSTLYLQYMNDITGSYDYSKYAPDETSIFSLSAILQRTNANPLRLVNNKGGNIAYKKYFDNGIGIGAEINRKAITPYFNTYFTYDGFTPYIYSKPGVNNDYSVNEASVSLRYAYREKYVTQQYVRGSLGSPFPILTLAFTKGIKINNGLLKSDFNYHKWDLDIRQDITFGRIGKLSYNIDAGIVKGVLPVVFLDIPRGNYTYYYSIYAFNNMDRYEFATDKYVSLMVQQSFGSFPFKYIPLLKKTRWRSLATFKSVLGGMSEANKKANGFYDTSIEYPFYIPGKTPYMETGVGIYNILNFLRLDAVWRLNYLDHPNIQKFGVKMSFQFQF